VEGVLLMDDCFTSPQLFSHLYSSVTVLHNRKGIPENLGSKTLKKVDLLCKVKGGTSAVCCKDKQEVYFSTIMHQHQVIMWTVREMSQKRYALNVTTATSVLLYERYDGQQL
jgi:hypothetical protein